ncbi:MAG TPA: hypothetical protein VE993_09850 [Stellaceae bacterium]|nr:hypothetical protein [Stellaceae bacterium]
MGHTTRLLAAEIREEEGCAYLFTSEAGAAPPRRCGALRRSRSPYCPQHHVLCHLPRGSRAEKVRLREVKTLAKMVGGRRGRDEDGPPQHFLDRLEEAVRVFS